MEDIINNVLEILIHFFFCIGFWAAHSIQSILSIFLPIYFRPEKHKKISSTSSSATSTSSSSSTVSSRPTTSSTQQVTPSTSATGASASAGAGAGAGAERKPAIMAVDGQKTVAQLQSERAAQQMHYRGPPSSAPHGGSSRPIQAPAARLSDRHPRGSPPSAGFDAAGVRQSGARAPVAGAGRGMQSPLKLVT